MNGRKTKSFSRIFQIVNASVYLCFVLVMAVHALVGLNPKPMTGKLFIFGVPMMKNSDGKSFMYLYSFNDSDVSVQVTFPSKHSVASRSTRLTLTESHIVTVPIDSVYNTRRETSGRNPTFKLTGDADFGVYIFLLDAKHSVASLQLLPVSSWGVLYYFMAVNLSSTTFVLIITCEVNSDIAFSLLDALNPHESGQVHQILRIRLEREEMYVVFDCMKYYQNKSIITGSSITGASPFAVITGGCFLKTSTTRCEQGNTVDGITHDITAEILLPVQLFGQEFITLSLADRRSNGDLMVSASHNETEVTVFMPSPRSYSMKDGDWTYLQDLSSLAPFYVTSSKPIQMTLFQRSACLSTTRPGEVGELGDPAMSIVVPTTLFYYKYMWRTPNFESVSCKHYIILVSSVTFERFLLINQRPAVRLLNRLTVVGNASWIHLSGSISTGDYVVRSSRLKVFGCYFYGLGERLAYMQPGGFLNAPGDASCVERPLRLGDGFDNDCDGKIDEESDNRIDDDADDLIDEDSARTNYRNGYWSYWSEWQCTRNCSDSTKYRRRLCNRPVPESKGIKCFGQSTDSIDSTCFLNTVCPADCPHGTYGTRCTGRCPHCLPDCDKFNGTCPRCKPGWRNEFHSCSDECESGTFGPHCNHSCYHKCGTDCLERVTGQCEVKGTKKDLMILLVLAIVSPVCCIQCCMSRTEEEFDEDMIDRLTASTSAVL